MSDTSWVSCSLTQSWCYLTSHQIPQVKGSVPQDCPPPPSPLQTPVVSSSYHLCLWPTSYKIPTTAPLINFINLFEQPTEPKETFTHVYQFIKGYDKGYRWAARWRGQSLRGSWVQGFLPLGVGVHHPPGVDVFTSLEALWTLYY